MSTATEFDMDYQHFQRFVEWQAQNEQPPINLEEALRRYRCFQNELERVRELIEPAYQGYLKGEYVVSNIDELKRFIHENRDPLP